MTLELPAAHDHDTAYPQLNSAAPHGTLTLSPNHCPLLVRRRDLIGLAPARQPDEAGGG